MNPGRGACRDARTTLIGAAPTPYLPKPRPQRHIRATIGDLLFPLGVCVNHWLTSVSLPRPHPPPLRSPGRVSVLERLIISQSRFSPALHVTTPPGSRRRALVSPHQITQVFHWLLRSSRLRKTALRLATQTQAGLKTEWDPRSH